MIANAPPASATRAVRIDYCTLSMDRHHLDAVLQAAEARFGRPKSGKGICFLRTSKKFQDGRCVVAFDTPENDPKPYIVLSITGDGCKALGDDALIDFVEHLRATTAARVTRLDIAVDHFRGTFPVDILEVYESCRSGELMRARTFRYQCKLTTAGEKQGETLDIGQRGKKGSGRSVCLYDKGLQTETEEHSGAWIRWEARFSDQCADVAYDRYSRSGDLCSRMRLAYDVVEFRQVTGDNHSERRPPCDWWAKLRDGAPPSEIIRRTRKDSSAATLLRWMSEVVTPILSYVRKETGVSMEDLMSVISSPRHTEGYKPKENVRTLVHEITDGPCNDDGEDLGNIYAMLFERTVQEV